MVPRSRTDTTVNKPRQQHPPLFTKVPGAPRAPEGNSWHRRAPRGAAVGEEEDDSVEQRQRSGHKTCPTKTQHNLGLQGCYRDEAVRAKASLLFQRCFHTLTVTILLFQSVIDVVLLIHFPERSFLIFSLNLQSHFISDSEATSV